MVVAEKAGPQLCHSRGMSVGRRLNSLRASIFLVGKLGLIMGFAVRLEWNKNAKVPGTPRMLGPLAHLGVFWHISGFLSGDTEFTVSKT